MRAIWKGHIRLNFVMIPIKVFRATQPKGIQFHNLHKTCHTRLKNQRYCPQCSTVVEINEVVRGYEYAKEKYVVVEEEYLEKVSLPSTHVIDIVQFVDSKGLDPIYFYEPHYVAPDGEVAREAYALLRTIMKEKGRVALAKVVMANKEHLVAIRPYNNAIVMSTMLYPEEIIKAEELENIDGTIKLGKEELKLATTLAESITKKFHPEEFKDEYTRQLLEIINAKIAGKEVVVAPRAEVGKVINLMEALRKSVKQTQAVALKRRGMVKATSKPAAQVIKKSSKAL
jgi:DNA end-binding protein Ku